MKQIFYTLFYFTFAICAPLLSLQAQWVQTNGPYGGTIYSFAVSPASDGTGGTNLFAGTWGGGVFLSTDNGTSWSAVNSGLTKYLVMALAVSPASGGTGGTNLFAGTWSGGVFLSTNNGTSWSAVNAGLTTPYVYSLAVSPASGGTGGTNLFAGTYGGVFLSTNNGTSWTQTGLTVTNVRTLAVSPASGGSGGTNLFAGTYGAGVFLSTNNGTSWSRVDSGLTNTWVFALATSPNGAGGTNLFAGTSDGGVWRRPLSEMITSVERLSTDLPTHFSLGQNYPNPFNPATVISDQLAVSSKVNLKIFDILGREVATLVNEEKPAGTYSVQWNAANMPSGVYFYRLQASDFVETKKLVLIK